MNSNAFSPRSGVKAAGRAALVAAALMSLGAFSNRASSATTLLADEPLFSNRSVPGNLALALSVEYPTAVSVANIGDYATATSFLGYFDPNKCYLYNYSATEADRYFYPAGSASSHVCSGKWSGSYLNWATMQTIDPFRWALTGGYRVKDTATLTVIEKAYATGQGGTGNFPDRRVPVSGSSSTLVGGATPFTVNSLTTRIQGLGNKMRFSTSGDVNAGGTPTAYNPANAYNSSTVYEVSVRVKVCDNSAGSGGVESNCTAYGSNYKPEGLIQQYSKRIRFSAFGYLNDSNLLRDGGVLRARQKFVGPMQPRPGLTDIANTKTEWDGNTGVFIGNPDATDAADTATLFGVTVSNSGVINYLNKFGEINPGSYKTYDPVSELYYAAVRYFKNLGNVPEWTAPGSASASTKATWVDGFPVITNWDDPIQYSCQKNYILGVGDVNTHADKNVPGATTPTGNEPSKPSSIVSDTSVNAVTATNKVGSLEGLGSSLGTTNPYNGCCNNNSALIAGLAYDSHTVDIRPDNGAVPQTKGMQTISTYWLDVLEYGAYKPNNQYFLATKYGGFQVPNGYSPYTAASAPAESTWHNNSDTLFGSGNKRPDNYFYASKADQMIAGLTNAFASIASDMKANSTGLAVASPQLTASGNAAYSAQYDANGWTGEITAYELTVNSNQALVLNQKWKASEKLATQLTGTGWNTNRRVVSWDGSTGVAFRSSGSSKISASQLTALDTAYGAGTDGAEYLNYLRGDRSNEQGSLVAGAKGYRIRTSLLGDISGSKTTAVRGPSFPYSDAANPGYTAFKTTYANRMPMVYVGANDGMLHAFNGSISSASGGTEQFAYVPSALFNGPTAPGTDGLAALGNPNFTHHYYADSTPRVFDVNFSKTVGATVGAAPDWHTLLIGGLGKGGKSFYAIDVTNPDAMTSEAAVAGKVMWEFPNASTPASVTAQLGFSYGAPIVTKTAKYGWVVIFTSGYNNTDGGGHFFFVNPRTGALLETVSTGSGSASEQTGLAHAVAWVQDYTDNLAESVYAGDLLGNVWRLDVRGSSGNYAPPTKIATLGTAGVPQPVTTAPSVGVHLKTGVRYVMIGTGRLLDQSDIGSTEMQSFYSIADGTTTRFNSVSDLPSAVGSFPITRNNLVELTNTLIGTTPDPSRPMGWYMDLGKAPSGIASRMVVNANNFKGVVAFASTLPSGDACSPSGTSNTYGVDIATGKTQLVDKSNGSETPVSMIHRDDVVIDVFIIANPPVDSGAGGGGGGGLPVPLPPASSPSSPDDGQPPGCGQQSGPGNAITVGYQQGSPESLSLTSQSCNGVSRINWRQLKLPN